LFNALRTDVTGILLTDTAGGITSNFGLPAVTTLYQDPLTAVRSLRAGAASLDAIVTALNTAFAAAPPPRRWTAVRRGYRIVLKSNLPTPDFGPGTTIATAGGGAYNFAAGTSYLRAPASATAKAFRPGAAIGLFVASSLPGLNGTAPNLAAYDAAYTIVRR